MKSSQLHYSKLVQGLLAALLFGAAGATCANTMLPSEHTQGDVSYLSGGVGHEEAMAIKAEAPHYPLMLEFVGSGAGGHSEYLAGDKVVIRDQHGKTVLDTTADGPLLLARLPAGKYKITAINNGKSERRMVTIKPNLEKQVVFQWKNPDKGENLGG